MPKMRQLVAIPKGTEQKSALTVVPVSKRQERVKRQKARSSSETGEVAKKAENPSEGGAVLQAKTWKVVSSRER